MSRRWQPAPVAFRHVCGWTGYDANGDARCAADYYHSWSGKDRRGDHHPALMSDGCGDVLHRPTTPTRRQEATP